MCTYAALTVGGESRADVRDLVSTLLIGVIAGVIFMYIGSDGRLLHTLLGIPIGAGGGLLSALYFSGFDD